MNKFRAVKCREQYPDCPSGHASLREHRRWEELAMLERGGFISGLEQQVCYELAPGVMLYGRRKPPLRYICDFHYFDRGAEVLEDCKGVITPIFRMKAHLMKALWNLDIKIT